MLYHNFVKVMYYMNTFYTDSVLVLYNSTGIDHP